MTTPVLERIPESGHPDFRFGRHIHHDPRSVNYAVGVKPKSAIKSVSWTRRIPILNQGQLGSCTGNAATGILGTDTAYRTATTSVTISAQGAANSHGVFTAGTYALNEDFAVKLYSLATILDEFSGQYPPTDTGSSGIGVAKALAALGLADTYSHAFSIDALNSALQTGPVIIGINWYNSMFDPKSDGQITVNVKSGLAGGHEMEISAYDASTNEYEMDNSWDLVWGNQGRGYFVATDLKMLLSLQGDVTVPHLLGDPVAPMPPAPSSDPDADLIAATTAWNTAYTAWRTAVGK